MSSFILLAHVLLCGVSKAAGHDQRARPVPRHPMAFQLRCHACVPSASQFTAFMAPDNRCSV